MVAAVTRIFLIRHAASAPADDIPDSQWPLSEKGYTQAQDLVRQLASRGITRLFSSPYRRAVETVQPLSEHLGLPIDQVTDLRERKLTDGMRPDWEQVLQQAWSDFSFALPGCESSGAAQARVRNAIVGIACNHPGETVAIASHGNAIGLFLNSIDSEFGYAQWRAMKNPEIFHLTWHAESWQRQRPI